MRPLRDDVLFLDVESSGFGPGSFPVEVGLSDDALSVRSWLVRPEPGWVDWDPDVERVHGLTVDLLRRTGLPAAEVAREVRMATVGRTVVSTSPDWDAWWLRALSAVDAEPWTMAVVSVHEAVGLYVDMVVAGDRDGTGVRDRPADVFPHRHRAGPDAEALAASFRAAFDPGFLVR